MPVQWELTIQKRIGEGKPWVNKYFLSNPDVALASVVAEAIVAYEQDFHYPEILFTSYRMSAAGPDNDVFYIVPLNINGTRSASPDLMPLFNTVQVYFVVDGGRPSFKYYRCLTEGDQTSSTLTVGMLNAIESAYTANIVGAVAAGEIVDESGNEFTSISINPIVKNRSRTRRARARSSSGSGNPS